VRTEFSLRSDLETIKGQLRLHDDLPPVNRTQARHARAEAHAGNSRNAAKRAATLDSELEHKTGKYLTTHCRTQGILLWAGPSGVVLGRTLADPVRICIVN